MTSKLFKTSIILIVFGVAMLVILQVLYAPKIESFRNDSLNYSRNWPNNTQSKPPVLEDYGLDLNTMFLVLVLGNIAYVLLILGVAFLVILLIARIINLVRGYSEPNSASETPKHSIVMVKL